MEARSHPLAGRSPVGLGRPYPLGAIWDGAGVNFALYSEHAAKVELCLFDAGGRRELERIELVERSGFVWHVYLPQARPGQRYGYRVHGPQAPEEGHRFNAHKVLLDPYARLILQGGLGRCQVVDEAFSWGDDRPPRTPWCDTVIYEAHVRGLTQLHPAIGGTQRGTYAGLAMPPVIEHLQRLGVTAVELLPVHAFVDERRLVQHRLRNYWGYNSIGFFAPELRYSATGTLGEFKTMVKTLHAAGLEVILDVVYNHTGEGDDHGPTLSFRGIDNSVYYRLDPLDRRHYLNYTGTGNCLNTSHPAVLALVMDSLRYWVNEMHVDGFRFDLAVALTRDSAFLAAIQQDPVLSQVKLIAEPWDLGPHGYRLGGFPPGWAEWNDKYRDTVRSWWRGDAGMVGALASRLAGSSDLFEGAGREPTASVNLVTAHDGFTLHDLVSYEHKQNEANLEGNRDGAEDNRSWNAGSLREQQKRNLLATLLLSQGIPMLLAGDELGRTQRGNNNAYCQDNEVSWLDWEPDAAGRDLLAFASRLTALRKQYPALRRRHYARPGEVVWLKPQGGEMGEEDWRSPFARCLGMLVPGEEDLLLLLNAHHEPVAFTLPPGEWSVVIDTSGGGTPVQAHSLVLLKASGRGPARAGA
ncbi:MAG: isoamylase [Betaproteobacteria bacterium]|nr:isoamylase [Betaproteobacteria bacterium]